MAVADRPWYMLPLSKANVLVAGGTFVFVLLTRSVHAAYFGAASIGCSLAAKGLKRLLRQPRPPGAAKPYTYGMPSTHTSAMAFQALYVTFCSLSLSFSPLALFLGTAYAESPPEWLRWTIPGVYVPYAVGVAWSRLVLGHHTVPQVLGGAVWGVACAWGAYVLWPWVRDVVAEPVVRMCRGWLMM